MIPLGDSDYGKWRDYLELDTSIAVDRACIFLEGHGQRFLVDFGTDNAIDKAHDLKRQFALGKPTYPLAGCNS